MFDNCVIIKPVSSDQPSNLIFALPTSLRYIRGIEMSMLEIGDLRIAYNTINIWIFKKIDPLLNRNESLTSRDIIFPLPHSSIKRRYFLI